MNSSSIERNGNGVLVVNGQLTFSTVNALWEQSCDLFDALPSPIQLDFKQVTQSDSAGVALLIAWVRHAREHSKEICLLHLPDQMQALIKVSGLAQVLQNGLVSQQ